MGHFGGYRLRRGTWFVGKFPQIGVLVFAVLITSALLAVQRQTNFALFIDTLTQQYGTEAGKRGTYWQAELRELETRSTQEQLDAINRFFNQRIRWQSDQSVYGVSDFWATPAETLGRGRGDCEDFTIAKYASLLHLGIPPEQLRLTYVKLRRAGGNDQAHMVLAWYAQPGATPLILDNANPTILPASQRGDLKPIFSFNSKALWIGSSSQSADTNPSARLSQWRQMLARAQTEGIRF